MPPRKPTSRAVSKEAKKGRKRTPKPTVLILTPTPRITLRISAPSSSRSTSPAPISSKSTDPKEPPLLPIPPKELTPPPPLLPRKSPTPEPATHIVNIHLKITINGWCQNKNLIINFEDRASWGYTEVVDRATEALQEYTKQKRPIKLLKKCAPFIRAFLGAITRPSHQDIDNETDFEDWREVVIHLGSKD